MPIPFTQYVLPNGRRKSTEIDRPQDVEAIARRFIDAGGRYECEILTTGQVSFTAVKEIDGETIDVEIEICANGPCVGEHIDALVRRSANYA